MTLVLIILSSVTNVITLKMQRSAVSSCINGFPKLQLFIFLIHSGNAKSLFSCHICEIEYETVHHLNGHYAVHYKDQLRARVANETPGNLLELPNQI